MINAVKTGFKWTTFSTVFLSLSAILRLSILARFLDKEDFGLMAIVTFFLGFMDLFMDLGLSSAILHRQNITKKEYSSLYWLNIIFSLLVFLIVFISSPLISSFYDEPQLTYLLPIAGTSIIFSGIGRQFKTISQKQMRFRFMSINDIIGSILGLVVATVLAIKDYGVFALVFASIAQNFISNILFFYDGIKNYGLSKHFNFNETRSFLNLGLYQAGGQVINYFNRDFDILIIGKVFGAELLGGYSLAKQLVRRPLQFLNPVLMRVGLSSLPKMQSNKEKLSRTTKNIFKVMGLLNLLIFGLMSLNSHLLIKVFYGIDSDAIATWLSLFCFLLIVRSFGTVTGLIVVTLGKTRFDFYFNLITTLLTPIALFIATFYSINAVIYSLIILQVLFLLPVGHLLFKKYLNINLVDYLKLNLMPFIILAFLYLFYRLKLINPPFDSIFYSVLLLLFAYFVFLFSIKKLKLY